MTENRFMNQTEENVLVSARIILDEIDKSGDKLMEKMKLAQPIIRLVAKTLEIEHYAAFDLIMAEETAALVLEDDQTSDTAERFKQQRKTGFNDVLMVAFDITADTAEQAHKWLQSKMPGCYSNDDVLQGITLDAWWIANDERFDGSDTDSAVFVTKGYQNTARDVLRETGLSH